MKFKCGSFMGLNMLSIDEGQWSWQLAHCRQKVQRCYWHLSEKLWVYGCGNFQRLLSKPYLSVFFRWTAKISLWTCRSSEVLQQSIKVTQLCREIFCCAVSERKCWKPIPKWLLFDKHKQWKSEACNRTKY